MCEETFGSFVSGHFLPVKLLVVAQIERLSPWLSRWLGRVDIKTFDDDKLVSDEIGSELEINRIHHCKSKALRE